MSVSISQQVLDTLQNLSSEDQKMVLDFAVNLQNQKSATSAEPAQSFFDVAKEYIGRGEGPGDLLTNPDYMKGYGKDSPASNS